MRIFLHIAIVIVATAHLANGSDLFSAIRSNNVSEVSEILDKRGPAAINDTIMGGISGLHIAAAMNNRRMTGFLISAGARVDARTDKGFTPLHWASSKNAVNAAEVLIAMGANINAQTDKGITPLHWAANKNATNVVELLILSGADINLKTDDGHTPLHWAVKKSAAECYTMLLFKTVSDEESKGMLKTDKNENIDETDWNVLIDKNAQAGIKPVTTQGHPTAKAGESLILPIGHDTEIAFVWIESLGMWFGKYEITNAQYKRYKPLHSSMFREELSLNGTNQPAVYVSWKQAKIYCAWLNRYYADYLPPDFQFRLPTDEEWMLTAACGEKRIYPWGNSMPPKYGNFSDDAAKQHLVDWQGIKNYNDGFIVTCDVTESGVNEWGVYGLAGNVWEWCEDWYDTSYNYKVLHGGSWDYDEEPMLRIETQGFDRPDTKDDTIGFRVVVAKKKQ